MTLGCGDSLPPCGLNHSPYLMEILKVKFAAAPFLRAADRIMNTRIT
jgi:hypothetical protein